MDLNLRVIDPAPYVMAGATAADIDDWIPLEYDDEVVQRVRSDSVIERYGARVIMGSKTKTMESAARRIAR
jgi:hypothetical protein